MIARFSLLLAVAFASVDASAQLSASIRLNQVGLFPTERKLAVVPEASMRPLSWQLRDAQGRLRASGVTQPFGFDRWSGERVHRIDFSNFRGSGSGYRLQVGRRSSRPLLISADSMSRLPVDALGFFYQQRAGIPIEARLVGAERARPAGHVGEVATCVSGRDPYGNDWPGCGWSLDVSGGWYDAGDQGKYVVNGGISLWTLLNLHEVLPGAFPDGSGILPEHGNGIPDLLDEARWELEFFLRMQVPDGKRMAVPVGVKRGSKGLAFTTVDVGGMVHHKVADAHWTGIPTRPDQDLERRQLFPPSTAATLNFAAVTAQCARIWRSLDASFADRCLQASKRAYAAAKRHPDIYAIADFTGSGSYGDDDVSDEFFWAAAELFVTTGEPGYRADLERSPAFRTTMASEPGWPSTATLGLISLAESSPRNRSLRQPIIAAADRFLADEAKVGYAIPYAPAEGWPWGSTSSLLNRAMLLGLAYDYTHQARYRAAVVDSMDFLLGRNPLDRSFVTGYGANPMRRPHHRFWANMPERGFPSPPPGVISGGPNSINSPRADEPVGPTKGCAPQTCWIDDPRSFTTNEVAINWNAPLVWVSTWLDQRTRGAR